MIVNDTLTFGRLRVVNNARVMRWHPGFPGGLGDCPDCEGSGLLMHTRPGLYEACANCGGTGSLRDGWTGGDWGNAMAGEAGEACNIIKKLRRAQEGFRGVLDEDPVGLKEKLADELADLVTYADLVANYYGIDLGHAVAEKFNRVSELHGFPERLG